jgi:hypothetical protein
MKLEGSLRSRSNECAGSAGFRRDSWAKNCLACSAPHWRFGKSERTVTIASAFPGPCHEKCLCSIRFHGRHVLGVAEPRGGAGQAGAAAASPSSNAGSAGSRPAHLLLPSRESLRSLAKHGREPGRSLAAACDPGAVRRLLPLQWGAVSLDLHPLRIGHSQYCRLTSPERTSRGPELTGSAPSRS